QMLVTVGGDHARLMAEAFGPTARWVATAEQAQQWLAENLREGDVVLVKGSRGVGLDQLVRALVGGGG
ncbi:MAG: hypothetical protein NZ869_08700, partial [Thermoanaerobaculum sp.]|nr:hypothetical protein [Thermoanaerobaculum sp.]MDW7968285.1 hypothetical protein [Thermoanaerobaculum sp.]